MNGRNSILLTLLQELALDEANTESKEKDQKSAALEEKLSTVYDRAREESRGEARKLQSLLDSTKEELEALKAELQRRTDEFADTTGDRDAKIQELRVEAEVAQAQHELAHVQLSKAVIALHTAQAASRNGKLLAPLNTPAAPLSSSLRSCLD